MTGAAPELWLLCGSQHLYGPDPLDEVAANARRVATEIDAGVHERSSPGKRR